MAEVETAETEAPEKGAPENGSPDRGGYLDGVGDADLKAWAQNKGFPGMEEALESHRNLEKLLGSEKLPLPRDEGDAAGLERIYKALGRPDDAAGYGLSEREGVDADFAGEAGGWFHKAGLSARQAGVLADRWQAYVQARDAAEQQRMQADGHRGIAELEAEWGGAFDANCELARRAARQFGVEDHLPALERALGAKGLMSFLQRVGTGLAEAAFEDGAPSRGFSLSPDQARARIEALKADRGFGARYLARDAEATAEMERLHRIAFG